MRQEADSNEIVPNELTDRRQLLYGTVSIWNVQAYLPPHLPTVGWWEKRIFLDFRKWALCCRSGILWWVHFKNIGEFRCTHSCFFSFSSFLAFIQTKEQILLQAQPLKIKNKKLCSPIRETVKMFKDKCWIWGPLTISIWHNFACAQFLLFLNHSTLSPSNALYSTTCTYFHKFVVYLLLNMCHTKMLAR